MPAWAPGTSANLRQVLTRQALLDSVWDFPGGESNVVDVTLQAGMAVDLARLERHFYAASSCGVCGKSSIWAADRRM